MKVVIDTNVLASGIFWGGIPLKILNLWATDQIQLIASEYILDEYLKATQKISENINRPDLYTQWSLTIPQNCHMVKIKKSFRICRDPKDDKFLDCAIAGRARYLISGDKDLLVLKRVMKVEIVTPRQFLDHF